MKNFTKKTSLFVFLIFIFSKTNAQDFPYSVVTETGTYSNLVGATELTSVGDNWDDPSFSIPLDFIFEFFGVSTNSVLIDDFFLGGMVTFSDLDTEESTPVIVAYFDDIIDVENMNSATQSTISHLTEGSAGNRIFKMEWNNCGFYNEYDNTGTSNNIVNFQLWIYEATGNIEIRFGASTIPDPAIVHYTGSPMIGLMDEFVSSTDDFNNFWLLSGDPTAPTLDTVTTFNDLYAGSIGFTSEPASGMIYRFEKLDVSTKNLIQELNIKVYPTLVQNEFFVEMDQKVLDKKTQLIVLNNLGQEIFSKNITNTKERLDASNFPKGIYYVNIINEDGSGVQKIIKN